VFLAGAKPSKRDRNALVAESFDPKIRLFEKDQAWWLEMNVDPTWRTASQRSVVTSEWLGKAAIPNAPFETPDGKAYAINTDYFGCKRAGANPEPGPFCLAGENSIRLKVWPVKSE
jgi:hypothetical protein